MLKMHFLYERLHHTYFDILIFPEDTTVGWTVGIHSWEIRDLFLDLFPAFTCTRSMFVLQGCSCVSSPAALRLTATAAPVGALFANAIAAKHKVAN